ncbi:stage III sporulation protein AB [Alicyclobacillus tolerans]|uniref:stage III sporulation protein SpoIIIAB n=1 Tax=Alicyclobacillus tolerans TaxID=90970 RepID=UPI001F01F507|nr:stage III sporulation protein SpoIIIAB [Alicyclobacillus tolerans]MCF8563584.1 stage III sporulation protein AB [Alicyclobacillus tolerans]
MIRLVGSALLLVSTTGIGFRVAREFRERPRQIRGLMHGLRVLQTEIEYSATPLPQALNTVAKRTPSPVNGLFAGMAEELQVNDLPVSEVFHLGVKSHRENLALKNPECEVLEEFGKTLGLSDRMHQGQQLQAALAQLEHIEREARDLQLRNERLWQYLGILMGLLLVILLY